MLKPRFSFFRKSASLRPTLDLPCVDFCQAVVIDEPITPQPLRRHSPKARRHLTEPDLAFELLKADFPWIAPFVIKVSMGFVPVIGDLLCEIEEIVGDTSVIEFLRISESASKDIGSLYKREVGIFFEVPKWTSTKSSAVNSAIKFAEQLIETTCCNCSGTISVENPKDPRLLIASDTGSLRSMYVCLPCELALWVEVNGEVPDAKRIDSQASSITRVPIFTEADIDKMIGNAKGDSKDRSRIEKIVNRIRSENSSLKPLAKVRDDWFNYCDDLLVKFPNFTEVVCFIRNQMALSSMGDHALRIPPFLLVGLPGIGKTEFALTLSNDLNTRLEVINIAASQTGSTLSGSEAHWGNTKQGELFDILVFGDVANPIIMLDEIDKARKGGDYDPLSTIYQLLDKRQASQFKDLSFPDLTLDASHVIWIGTANNIDALPAPIVDRFKVFNIAPPLKSAMPVIIKSQYDAFLKNHPSGQSFTDSLDDGVIEYLAAHHPRKTRKIIEEAFGAAALDSRNYLTVQDVVLCNTGERKTGMGFLAGQDSVIYQSRFFSIIQESPLTSNK